MYVREMFPLFFFLTTAFVWHPRLAGPTCLYQNCHHGDRSHEAVLIHDGRRGARGSLGGFSLAGGDGLNNANSRLSTAAGGGTQSRPISGSGGVTGGAGGSGAG